MIYFDKEQIQRVFYNFFLRRNYLRTRGGRFTGIYTLDYGADRRPCFSADTPCKYQYEKQQSYTQMSCGVCNYNISRIHCRLHRKPRAAYERLGLFGRKIQRSRSDMSPVFNVVVSYLHTGCNTFIYTEEKFTLKS